MAVAVFTQSKIYLAQFDVSGDHNKVTVENPANELDGRVFGNTAGNTQVGLYQPKFSGQGYVTLGVGSIKDELQATIGVADVPVTVVPETGAVGNVAIFMKAIHASKKVGGPHGEILPFTIEAKGRGVPAIGGRLMIAAGNKTVTSSGGDIELGAVSATQKVYLAYHVLFVSGTNPTLAINLVSDTAGFPSATSRISSASLTGLTSGFQELVGPITDTWWRISYSIGGTATPTFSFVVAAGIF